MSWEFSCIFHILRTYLGYVCISKRFSTNSPNNCLQNCRSFFLHADSLFEQRRNNTCMAVFCFYLRSLNYYWKTCSVGQNSEHSVNWKLFCVSTAFLHYLNILNVGFVCFPDDIFIFTTRNFCTLEKGNMEIERWHEDEISGEFEWVEWAFDEVFGIFGLMVMRV